MKSFSKWKVKGFSLVEVLIAVGILSIIALAMSQFVIQSMQSVTYLEDKLSKVSLEREIKDLLLTDLKACEASLKGLTVGGAPINLILKNASNQPVFKTNDAYEDLKITSLQLENVDVANGSTAGYVRVVVKASRTKKGGGPEAFKPMNIKVRVGTTAAMGILDCTSEQTGVKDMCVCAYSHDERTCNCCDGPGWTLMGTFDQDGYQGFGRSSMTGHMNPNPTHFSMNLCVK